MSHERTVTSSREASGGSCWRAGAASGRQPMRDADRESLFASRESSTDPAPAAEPTRTANGPVPVMYRRATGRTKFTLYGEYTTFDEAAAAVARLRSSEGVAWAYIPDEYAEIDE